MIGIRYLLAASGAALLVGCGGAGGGIDGTYCAEGQTFVLKAGVISSQGESGSYKLDGENIMITNPDGQATAFRREPDGSLKSPAVTLKKCAG